MIFSLSHSLKWFWIDVFSVQVYPFFEPTRLSLKKLLPGVFFYIFSNSLNVKKISSLPSLGLLKLHGRGLIMSFLIAFASLRLWPNVGSMLLSTEPLKHALYTSLVARFSSLTWHLDPWRNFLLMSFSYTCLLSMRISVFSALGNSMLTTLVLPL